MPGACCTRGLVCKMDKSTHTSIQVQPEHSGIPCARKSMGEESLVKSMECRRRVQFCVTSRCS